MAGAGVLVHRASLLGLCTPLTCLQVVSIHPCAPKGDCTGAARGMRHCKMEYFGQDSPLKQYFTRGLSVATALHVAPRFSQEQGGSF